MDDQQDGWTLHPATMNAELIDKMLTESLRLGWEAGMDGPIGLFMQHLSAVRGVGYRRNTAALSALTAFYQRCLPQ